MAENEVEVQILSIISDFFGRHRVNIGDGLLLALSGGVDSTALLYVMSLFRDRSEFPVKLYGLHVNHRLRPDDETERDWKVVQLACRRCGVPVERFQIGAGEVERLAESTHCGLEAAARDLRYKAVRNTLQRLNVTYALLGHTADDLAETMITRFLQGRTSSGLHGIPSVRDYILRPLLHVPKETLVEIVRAVNLPWSNDSSNDKLLFQRNRVRNTIVPLIRREFPGFRESLVQGARLFMEDDFLLNELADRRIPWNFSEGSAETDSANFRLQPITLRLRALLSVINRIIPDAERVSRNFLLSMPEISGITASRILLDGHGIRIEQRGQKLIVLPSVVLNRKTRYLFRVEYGKNGSLGNFNISWANDEKSSLQAEFSLFIPESRSREPVILRSRRINDKIRLSGKFQRLKGIFNAMKIPEKMRDSIPVLQIGTEIAAIPGALFGYKNYLVRDFYRENNNHPGVLLTIHNGV